MNRQTRNKITYLSFLLAISIIWHHAYNVNVYSLTGVMKFIEDFLLNCFESSVSVFFMISAFLFYYNYSEEKLLTKLKSRVFSLVIPYIIWNLIGYLYYQVLSVFPIIRQYYGGSIESFSVLGMLKACISGDYNLVTWFLLALIIYTFTLPFVYKFTKTKTGSSILLIISLAVGSIYGGRSNVCAYLTYYCLGLFIAVNCKDLFMKRYNDITKILALVVYLIFVLIFTLSNIPDRSLFRILIYCVLAITMWIFVDVLAVDKEPKQWMKYSFVFYVSHEMILEPIEKIFLLVLGNNTFGAIIDFIVAPILTATIIILLCALLKKIPFLWNLISGNR